MGTPPLNPARLSTDLAGLFPAGAVAAELRGAGDAALLLPAEARRLGQAVPKRVREFAAGRSCARRALAEFGIVDFPLEAAADRRPIWPRGMVGSITHTAGFCAAVVADLTRASSLGIDSEAVCDVKEEIWPSICLPIEIDWVHSLPPAEQAAAAALIFSAKEAFYKCQYPVTHEFLGFHDVRAEAEGWGDRGSFRIHALRRVALQTPMALRGHYLFHEQFVSAGMSFAPAET